MPTISDAQALRILNESANKTHDLQARAHGAAMGSQIQAKLASAKSAVTAAKGDQYSCLSKAAIEGGAALFNANLNRKAQIGLTPKDKTMSPEAQSKKMAHNAGINAATQGNGVGQVINQGFDAVDQNAGFAKMSSDAKIAGKYADLDEVMASQRAETAKSLKERAQKAVEGVEDFAKGFADRAKQVFDKMF